jgi:hypothetical protein
LTSAAAPFLIAAAYTAASSPVVAVLTRLSVEAKLKPRNPASTIVGYQNQDLRAFGIWTADLAQILSGLFVNPLVVFLLEPEKKAEAPQFFGLFFGLELLTGFVLWIVASRDPVEYVSAAEAREARAKESGRKFGRPKRILVTILTSWGALYVVGLQLIAAAIVTAI